MLAALIAAGAGELGTAAAAATATEAATAAAAAEAAAAATAATAPTIAASALPGITAAAPEVFSATAPAAEGIAEGASRFAPQVPNPVDTTAPMQVNTAGQNVAPAQEGIRTTQAATAPTPTPGSPGNPVDINQGLLRGVDYEAIPGFDVPQAGAAAEKSGLEKGIQSALKFSKDYPIATSLGITALGSAINQPSSSGAPPKKQYARKDMSGFQASEPSTVAYNPVYKPTPYAVGGTVEQMAAQNAVGQNTMYPQSQLQTPMYANPMVQRPMPSNVIGAGIDAPTDRYTGEQRMASGGSTKSEPNYSQMMGIRSAEQQKADEEYLQALAKREMAGSINTDTDVDTRNKDPLNASLAQLKKIGKRVGAKTVELPKSGITDSNVFHAAQGGIMHGLGGYSDGGRLLKGPGDGVSDSIPATIGNKQPARLADGEFVVPARIVSELGNGSTAAGARKLYEMMDRVQADRKKSIGKGKVAVNSKAAKHLPK